MLVGQKTGNNELEFMFDSSGDYYGFEYNDKPYYYFKNLQGDVVAVGEDYNTVVATYEYDAWGRLISSTDTSGVNIGAINPIRYRGYYYDTETGFYFLQTRYYVPEICRFLSADGAISEVGGEVLGYNQFAYCFNNPVNMDDSTGNWPKFISEIINRVKYVFNLAFRIFTMPIKSLDASIGVGKGFGGEYSHTVGGQTIGISAKKTVTNTITFNGFKLDIKSINTQNCAFSIGNISYGEANGNTHSLLDSKCTCHEHNYSYTKQSFCPANENITSKELSVGISGGLYIGVGFEFSIGINLDALATEMIDIFHSKYEGYYRW